MKILNAILLTVIFCFVLAIAFMPMHRQSVRLIQEHNRVILLVEPGTKQVYDTIRDTFTDTIECQLSYHLMK